jgi:hypothetical protein
MPSQNRLAEFAVWVKQHLTGGSAGPKAAAAAAGGTAFADLVWKTVVFVAMKQRGADLRKHYRRRPAAGA